MIGKTILHYEILEKLGEGGMGVVYKAQDTKLDRTVAIKFLPRQIASSAQERQRFTIEAKAAAALNHTNIATIYAIEEVDDETFIVMEYIEGQELKDIVGAYRDTPLPLHQILNYATQIAEGLHAAHKKGIVHRDIKSANIMLTESGQVKIMDFGLAKVRGGAQITKVGATVGTAAYMSPEQARGDEIDHRTDIWSFGVVLYEMLAGRLPFKSDYEQALTYSILNEEPELDEIPAELQHILSRSLAKNIAERYQQVDELLNDLRALAPENTTRSISKGHKTTKFNRNTLYLGLGILVILLIASAVYYFMKPSQPVDSIAVLPFINSNNDPDIEYLSDGLTETLINKLSQLPQLRVMARSTVFRFKGKEYDGSAGRRGAERSSSFDGRNCPADGCLTCACRIS